MKSKSQHRFSHSCAALVAIAAALTPFSSNEAAAGPVSSSVGTARPEYTGSNGSGSAPGSAPSASLPEDVPIYTDNGEGEPAPRDPLECRSPQWWSCLYVDWNSFRAGAGTTKFGATMGVDKFGVSRRADSMRAHNGTLWMTAAVFGDYVHEGSQLCGCFRFFRGCFAPETKIRMGDQSEKAIEDISVGDAVWNPVTKKSVRVMRIIEGPEEKPLIELGFGATTVKVSSEHPVVVEKVTAAEVSLIDTAMRTVPPLRTETPSYELKQARDVKLGDTIRDANGVPQQITVYRELPKRIGERVINLELEESNNGLDDHMLLSGGVITGDFKAQLWLSGAREQ